MLGKMDCHGLTDIGRSRSVNEDQFLVADLNKSMLVHQTSLEQDDQTRLFGGSQGQVLLVADGMGGHAAGEQASAIAVESPFAKIICGRMSKLLLIRYAGLCVSPLLPSNG